MEETTQDDNISIEDAARLLRVSERTVYDWLQGFHIAVTNTTSGITFPRSALEKWISDKGTHSPDSFEIHVGNILSRDRVVFLESAHKNEAIIALSQTLAQAPQIKNRHELIHEMVKRDSLMTTAIGQGIAIPHVRLASVTDLVVAVGISRVDILDFEALDDLPVRILIMIAAAWNQHTVYLKTLAFFSSLLKKSSFRKALLEADSPERAYSLLVE